MLQKTDECRKNKIIMHFRKELMVTLVYYQKIVYLDVNLSCNIRLFLRMPFIVKELLLMKTQLKRFYYISLWSTLQSEEEIVVKQ